MSINRELIKDDLYQAVNGEWLKTAVIPDDKPSTGGFNDLVTEIETKLIKEFNELKNTDNDQMNEFLKFYEIIKDVKKRDLDGVGSALDIIKNIENTNSYEELQKKLKDFILMDLPLPFNFSIYADMSEATRNVLYLDPAGIILPDKTYYGTENEKVLIDKYSEMVRLLLSKFNYNKEQIEKLLSDTIKFDSLIYPNVKSSEESADYVKMNNPRTLEEVANYSNVIDFKALIKELVGENPEKIIVTEPVFFEHFNEIVTKETFEILKSWLIVKTALGFSNFLTEEIREIGSIYSKYLSGIDKILSVEKFAYYFATKVYSQVISVYYGTKHFGEKAKKDVYDMVTSMIEVYKKRLANNTWLNEKTSKSAIKKLESLEILVGYPDTYKDIYKKLIVDETKSFFENNMTFTKIMTEYSLSKWNKPVDRKEWGMSSNTVNAYYSPTDNLICFPAAILQAPFYSLDQSKSANYGGIGSVIGHEISHAFDNNGSKFDENGNINNWWTEEDYKTFDNLAKNMIAQFDGLDFAGHKVNGTLTVSENIADAGGLSCSLEALKNHKEYNLEEFFINFAKIWCRKARQQYMELLLKTDVHAPGELRANIQPRNLDDFYETFGVKEGDKMFMPKDKRVNIW
ncbi:M13 family metallopeptidase [Caviibacter abscessus]|uniref:M13 family metallopeptidase n=1 Tax=Caviibacter abscessus TaxID=1766719 RepID=UPI000837F8E1|nr:M13 family metallopeptidase [Caviibacter abscessus]